MRRLLTMILMAILVTLSPLAGDAQDSRVALDAVAKAMGAGSVKSIQYSGNGVNFQVGQNYAPDLPWPRFVAKSYTRTVSYETASIRDLLVRTLGENPQRGGGAGGLAPGGEQRQEFVTRGDFAWNVVGETAAPAPVALLDRQLQLWTTPHGVIKMASASNATVQGNTISFTVPGRFRVRVTVDGQNLVERIDAVVPNAVLGDMPVEIRYSEYKDFGGVKFPMKIRQTIGGHSALDLTVSDVQPNTAVNITIPEPILNTPSPYARVTSQMVADGVWYVTGGTHHSVVIEMKDHVILVESPINDDRAAAVLGEVKKLSSKPLKYVIASHHHFDHSGGLRAIAAEGVTVIAHDANKAFLEKTLSAPSTVNPDRLAKSGKKGTVEGTGARRALTDGTRTVDIHQITDNVHHAGLVMVHLPKERLLIEADVYTPPAPNAPAPTGVNPTWVSLADNITRLTLAVDQILPLHGRIVPLAELHKSIGR
ncbi:MAG: MBL fold metallo-hydrolase [Candidatus Rokuibacteriota bacterium]|nr:MAG: MBL fold metallo-hydrolase [Candidatus Rokubacteria bacterium]